VPPSPGPRTPATARVYDFLAGGHQNYAADAGFGRRIEKIYPAARRLVTRNRLYLAGAVRLAAARGITRFLDLGSGFPSAGSPARAAADACPEARVACVDWDRSVGCYGAVLARDGIKGVSVVQADIRDPETVLALPAVRETVSADEPSCLIFGLVLHALTRAAARRVVAGYAAAAAPGSLVAVTVPCSEDEVLFRAVRDAWLEAGVLLVNWTPDGIASLMVSAGLEVQPPGVGPVEKLAAAGSARRLYVAGAIGVKLARSP
jgi:hypothetical protein